MHSQMNLINSYMYHISLVSNLVVHILTTVY